MIAVSPNYRSNRISTTIFLCVFLLFASACEGPDPMQSFPASTSDRGNVAVGDASVGDRDSADAESPDTIDTSVDCSLEQCAIDGECFDNEVANPDNPCEVCLVLVDGEEWTPDDSATCDDEDLCTVGDHCFEGSCSAVVVTCEDGNPCTQNICDAETGACSNPPQPGSCSDGDPCTLGDACSAGGCIGGGEELDCEDGNPCTATTCEAGTGCVATPLSDIDCEDNNPCTIGDRCELGRCQPGPDTPSCDDEDVCTVDGCDPELGCQHNSIADRCADDNICTDERCDPERGCLFPFNDEFCNDGNACTDFDTCAAGACLGSPVDLTGDICNVLSCDPIHGVSVEYTELPCTDNNRCTVGDICDQGSCDPGLDEPYCDDENVCTDDDCDPIEECVHTNNTDDCDDGNACTARDRCAGGGCSGQRISCEDDNECTQNDCSSETGCLNTLIVANSCRPNITVTYPPRAATILRPIRTNTVTVTGNVVSGAGSITSFTVNGGDVTLDGDNNFSHPVNPIVGGNVLILEAQDSMGSTRRVVQSFLWSPTYYQPDTPKNGMITEGMGIFLSDEVLDDGDRTAPPDDFASIFELVLGSFDLSTMLSGKVASQWPYDIYIQRQNPNDPTIIHGDPSVTLAPKNGYLEMLLVIPDLNVGLNGYNTFTIFDPNNWGTFTADDVTVVAKVRFAVNAAHELVATVADADVSVTVHGGNFQMGGLIGLLGELFEGTLITTVEDQFEGAISSEIGGILNDTLGALAFDVDMDFPALNEADPPITINLITDFESVAVTTAGMTIIERAGAYGENLNLYDNRGAMGRANCSYGAHEIDMLGEGAFELALADDVINHLLYQAWQGKFLEFDVPGELFADVDLPDGVDISSLTAKGMLQPTASDCNADHALRVLIGDLRIDASMTLFGSPLDVILYASFEAGMELSAADGEIGFAITDIVSVETEIHVQQEELITLEPVLADMIAGSLVPGLLDALGGEALGGFPLPEIDLSTAVDGVPPGTVIAIDPQEVVRGGGNTFVKGALR